MKKIYKVVLRYGYRNLDGGISFNENWEYFTSKKAAFAFIQKYEDDGVFAENYSAEAKVYVMTAYPEEGRFFQESKPISDYGFMCKTDYLATYHLNW